MKTGLSDIGKNDVFGQLIFQINEIKLLFDNIYANT